MEFQIGNVKIKNQVVLAPMAGVSNPPYMKICEEMGVGYAITELISSEAIVRKNKKTLEMLEGYDKLNIPVAIQLFGADPEVLAKASQIVYKTHRFCSIDINMGCPVPKVALRAQAGSALLKDPNKVYEIVASVVQSVPIPVTVKIRSGWDSNHINAVDIAKQIEKAGAKAITVHGRTRSQGYSGVADWNIIKKVKEAVSIPVIGNGDIRSMIEAKKMLEKTGCDAIMIGRGVLGNPWLIKECVTYLETGILLKPPTEQEKIDMLLTHFNLLLETKSEKLAVLEIRSHAAWYLKGIPHMSNLKKQIFQVKTKEEFWNLLKGEIR